MSEENKTTIALLANEARAEHVEMRHLLEHAREELKKCHECGSNASAACVHRAMSEMQDHLERHFAREENGGWLEEAVVRAPHLAHRLTELEQQHRPLRERIAHLVKEAETLDGGRESVQKVREEFEKFAKQLLVHESYEERVLQQGFNEELDLE